MPEPTDRGRILKHVAKALLHRMGLDVHRIAKPVRGARRDDLEFYRTALGDVYLPLSAPNDAIIAHMRRGQVFEPEVVEIAQRYIRPGTTVIDLGSNFGQMAMLFARAVGDGHVYAFEAQRRVYDILCKNLHANGIENVRAEFKAAFNESGRIFHFPEPDFTRFAAFGSYNLPLCAAIGPEVTSIRIDEYEFERPVSFMKVDVQGCDLFAMQGAMGTIMQHRMPILFEFEQRFQAEYATTFQDYVDFVQSIDYRFIETTLDINFLIIPKESMSGCIPA